MTTQPEVIQILERFRADILDRESAQFQAMASRWLEVEGALEGRIFELATLAADQGSLTPGQLERWDRYVELLRQVRDEVARYVDVAAPEIKQRQIEILDTSIETARQALESMGVRVAAGFNNVNTFAVRDMVGVLADGTPLATLLAASWMDGAAALTSVLIKNTAMGVNPRQSAREMVRATGASLDRMLRIARTEQLRVSREATREGYQKSGVVKAYRRLASKDRRTCAACLIADGTLYRLEQAFVEHVNGRCALVPVIDGLDVAWTRGKDWLLAQPDEVQREILGPGRFDGWKAGKFGLDDIPEVHSDAIWGDSLQVRTLDKLLAPSAADAAPIKQGPGGAKNVMGFSFFEGQLDSVASARSRGDAPDGWEPNKARFLNEFLPRHGVTDDVENTIGLWGAPEPSFNARLTGADAAILALARDWGRQYNQEGMALLLPKEGGQGGVLSLPLGSAFPDEHLDMILRGMRWTNAALENAVSRGDIQSAPYLGLSIKAGNQVEYWFSTPEEASSVKLLLRNIFDAGDLQWGPQSIAQGFEKVLLFRDQDY